MSTCTFADVSVHLYVAGSKDERGITAWQAPLRSHGPEKLDPDLYDEGYDVYLPLLPRRLLQNSFMQYIPFLPYTGNKGLN